MWDALGSMVPMNRMATPEDIANAALFLASPESGIITAVSIYVDGGRSGAMPRRSVLPLVQKMKPGMGTYDKASYGAGRVKAMDVGLK